jgi:predicted molibdopterin-dependent oxidoreductase YjgC
MRPGTGAYPLRGHNNVQGASDHGSMPNVLPGYQSVDDPEVRARFEAAWQVAMPATPGLDNYEMVDAIQDVVQEGFPARTRSDERFPRRVRTKPVEPGKER